MKQRAFLQHHRQEAAPAAESLRSASLLIGGRRRTCTHLPQMATFGRGLLKGINRPAAAAPLRCIGAATPRAPAHQPREAGGA
jgi:hypothetical protein